MGTGRKKINWKKNQIAKARSVARHVKRRQKEQNKQITKKRVFLKALVGTCGIKSEIAKNLGCSVSHVSDLLQRPDWEDVREAYEDEDQRGLDLAEKTLYEMMAQRLDPAIALNATKYLLSHRRRKKFGDQIKTIVEGGEKPLRVVQTHIPVENLDLDPDTMRQIVEARDKQLEAQEKQSDETPAEPAREEGEDGEE